VDCGGVAEGVMKMSFGNRVGFQAEHGQPIPWYGPCPGAIIAELTEETDAGVLMGRTTQEPVVALE
jgi:phosphoribosylformylglycinamidine synthase